MRQSNTIKSCQYKNCSHLSRKGQVGYCTLKNMNLTKVKKCPKQKTVDPDIIPSTKHCGRCEQLKLTEGVWICKISGYRPHMMRSCPKVLKNV